MHRLTARCHYHKDFSLTSVVGGPIENCRLLLFADADFAGGNGASKSTSGGILVLVGPRTWAPLGAICKAQGAVSHSTTESEVISFEVGLRTEGLPALILWDVAQPYLCCAGGTRAGKATPPLTARGGRALGFCRCSCGFEQN